MAVESSADSYINAQPEEIMDYDTFWKKNNMYGTVSPEDQLMVRIMNFFTGEGKRVHDKYDAYVTNAQNRNEFLASQSARAYDKMMDDSKYQRMMKDFEAAGLNPYLLVNSGGISASSSPSGAKADYGKHQAYQNKSLNGDAGRNIALLLLAVARIAAAFM